MKFGNNLHHLSIPEWRCYNIDYNDLKAQIRQLTQSGKVTRLAPLRQSFVDNFDYINLFILTKHGELVRKVDYFQAYFKDVQKSAADVLNSTSSHGSSSGGSRTSKQELRSILYALDDIFYNTIEISIVVKNLSKFILIQKIAVKKILKKFLKYYTVDPETSSEFVVGLKEYLLQNPNSFLNFDLSAITRNLTDFMKEIKAEQRDVITKIKGSSSTNLVQDFADFIPPASEVKISPRQRSNTIRHGSVSGTSVHSQQKSTSNDSKFDLTVLLKKNFNLHFLVPDDPNTLSELILNLNIYLNFKSNNENASDVSFIYLFDKTDIYNEPSYIISHKNHSHSTIVAHTGGLRKYSYCILPNDIVQLFLDHLVNKDDQETYQKLAAYFSQSSSCLTKATIDTILQNNLLPSLKLICKRLRYVLKKNYEEEEQNQNDQSDIVNKDSFENNVLKSGNGSEEININPGNVRIIAPAASETKKRYQDDYLITLDHDIQTTNNPQLCSKINFYEPTDPEFTKFDKFPHNHLTFYSNDSNLSTFEHALETEIDVKNGILTSTYPATTLRKLPSKVQNLIANNNSLNLFKGLQFFQYMISCYFNAIPRGEYINNHYTNLLNLNLLKNFESIENFNNQLHVENTMIKAESSHVLKRKLSMKSFETYSQTNTNGAGPSTMLSTSNGNNAHVRPPALVNRNSTLSVASTKYSIPSIFTNRFEDNEEDDEDAESKILQFPDVDSSKYDEDYYSLYVRLNDDYEQDTSIFTNFILKSNKLKNTLVSNINKIFDHNQYYKNRDETVLPVYYSSSQNGKTKLQDTERYRGEPHDLENTYLFNDNSYGTAYDSINEEPTTFLDRKKFMNIHREYELEYDQTLAYIYFSLNLICIFLSGIELGIVYSIFMDMDGNGPTDSGFSIIDNLWLILVLIIGLLSSLIFSMISINLIFQRYNTAPLFHSFCVWGGFTIVSACCIWSSCIFLQGL